MVVDGSDTAPTRARLPDGVTITPTAGVPKIRRITKVIIDGLANNVIVHNNSLVNLVRGLAERVYNVESRWGFHPPPKPRSGAYGVLSEFANLLVDACGSSTRITYEQFVGMYTGRKASIYQKAVDSLAARPVRKSDSFLSTFVKAEKVVPSSAKPDPAPRVIQPRNTRYNTELGRFLKPLETRICKGITALWGGVTCVVMKGLTVEGVAHALRAKWDTFRRPVAIGLDASRFDQHVSIDALRWEHSVYARMFHGSDRDCLERLLSWQLRNRGFARTATGMVEYYVNGCRMSGDMNTGMGNCLIMCALVYTYAKLRGVKVELANNGDDCVVILESCDEARFSKGLSEWFLTMGFTMKVEAPVRVFEQIEFCRMHPVWAGDAWVMVRNPLDAIKRDCTTILSLPNLSAVRKWWYVVGAGGLSITGGVPIFQRMYSVMKGAGEVSDMAYDPWLSETGFMRLRSHRHYNQVTPEARYSFWLAFGITPDAQEAFENAFSLDCIWAPGECPLAGHTWDTIL